MTDDMKRCARCGLVLPLSAFYRNRDGRRQGTGSYCRACACAYSRAWQAAHREHVQAYLLHTVRERAKYQAAYWELHRVELLAKAQARYKLTSKTAAQLAAAVPLFEGGKP